MSLAKMIAEIKSNPTIKSKIIVFSYRCTNILHSNRYTRLLGLPFYILYRIIIDFIMGVEINYKTKIGYGLRVYHGVGIVINTNVIIGKNLQIRQGVTIGNTVDINGIESACPEIGDNVDIGAGAIILGDIKIANYVRIGAGAVVTKSVESGQTVIKFNEVIK